jgi:protein tyrosine/serine phosphatase
VKVVDRFIMAVADPTNQPVFVHCGSANRVAALWLAKRMLVDRWDQARALEEAKMIGLTSEALEKFALDYVAKRRGGG